MVWMRVAVWVVGLAAIMVPTGFAGEAATWGAPATQPAGGSAWSGGQVVIPVRGDATFGIGACPTMLVGNEFWSTQTGQQGAKIGLKLRNEEHRSISPDGKRVAVAMEDPKVHNRVGVFSGETGQLEREIQAGGADKFLEFVQFLDSKSLLTVGRNGAKAVLEIWDLATGKVTQSYPCERMSRRDTAISPDGRFMATVVDRNVRVIDVRAGRVLATLEHPYARKTRPGAAAAPAEDDDKRRHAQVFFYSFIRGMAFSCDSSELAVLTNYNSELRLLIWNKAGDLVMDARPRHRRTQGFASCLTWAPDGSGICLPGGVFFDRKIGRITWIHGGDPSDVYAFFLDKDRVLFQDGDVYRSCTVPWAGIRKSAEVMAGKTPAYIRPGMSLSVQIEIAKSLGGDQDSLKTKFGEALAQRLAQDDIKVVDNAPMLLEVKYEETQGETLAIHERDRFSIRGRDTGRKATGAKGAAAVVLKVRGYDAPIWREKLASVNDRSFSDVEISDSVLRESMIKGMASDLQNLDIPYFLPGGKELLPLPVILQ